MAKLLPAFSPFLTAWKLHLSRAARNSPGAFTCQGIIDVDGFIVVLWAGHPKQD